MTLSKLGYSALLLVAILNRSAIAQQKPNAGGATGDYPASPVDGTATGSGYYALFPGGVNYGLSGTFPNLAGYGYNGYGPGPQFGAHYPVASKTDASPAPKKAASPTARPAPKPSTSLTDLSRTLRKATKKPTGRQPSRTMP